MIRQTGPKLISKNCEEAAVCGKLRPSLSVYALLARSELLLFCLAGFWGSHLVAP